jgi:hypothetical protein
VIERCARLPLALAVVAARAASRPELPMAVFAAELADSRHVDGVLGDEAATDLDTALSWSYRALYADTNPLVAESASAGPRS